VNKLLIGGLVTVASALLTVSATADEISFENDVLPILNIHCLMCHMPGGEQGDLTLHPNPYGNLVNIPSVQSGLKLVEPGSSAQSYLYLKLIDTQAEFGGSGGIMPFQTDPLDTGQIEIIRSWIDQGAKNN